MEYKDFYKSKNIDLIRVHKIGLRKHDISFEQIEQGAKNLYDKLSSGDKLKDIAIVNRIWAEAKVVPDTSKKIHPYALSNRLLRLEDRVSQFELPWWKRNKWLWLFKNVSEYFPPTAM